MANRPSGKEEENRKGGRIYVGAEKEELAAKVPSGASQSQARSSDFPNKLVGNGGVKVSCSAPNHE